MSSVFFYSLALEDVRMILEALEEYSVQSSDRFLEDLNQAGKFLSEHPQAGHPAGLFRRWNLKRYPYHLLYLEVPEKEEIWIMVVRHEARHPSFGMTRKLSDS